VILLVPAAWAAPPGVALREGDPVVQPCLDDPVCASFWGPQLSETMIEIGHALAHDPVLTSAFGARGPGLVAEVALESVPLGERNVLQSLYPLVPGVPVLALGWQAGGVDGPEPQLAAGAHVVPPMKLGGGRTWAAGATASFAVPLPQGFWAVQLLPDTDVLDDIELLDPYFGRNGPECAEPCLDRLRQHAASIRVGGVWEPVPEFFVYGRGGLAVLSQRLSIAIDDSVWGWTPVLPELSGGLGGRAGDRWQVTLGATTAFRPESATTGRKPMTKIVAATGFRFGPQRR
jgi:hypothetical protein